MSRSHMHNFGEGPEEFELTDDQISAAREAFNYFDINKDGHIPTENLEDVMKNLGYNLKKEQLQDLIDDDENGTIEWDEFLPLMAQTMKEKQETAFYKELFRILDKKNKGTISCDHLRYILEGLKEEVDLTEDEIDDMIAETDEDGNGEVSFEEFYKLMTTE